MVRVLGSRCPGLAVAVGVAEGVVVDTGGCVARAGVISGGGGVGVGVSW